MKSRVLISGSRLRAVDAEGRESAIALDEVCTIHVRSATDAAARARTHLVLAPATGDALALDSDMEGWELLVRFLPVRFGVREHAWDAALRAPPSDSPVTVYLRPT